MRTTQFQTNEYYHIYNQGVDKRKIFCNEKDYIRFIRSMREFNRIDFSGGLYVLDNQRKTKETVEI